MRHLVLLGAGHAHVHVLHRLAQDRPADLAITLVTPHSRQLYSGMVPGFVAGHYTLDECMIPLGGLLDRCGARHVQDSAVGLDADARTVALANGGTVAYDWLSLNTGPIMDRERIEAQMPGARAHALFVRPIEAFGQLWPRVAAMARQQKIHLAVVGAGAAGLELAMAAAHALGAPPSAPGSRVTLVSGAQAPGASYPAGVQRRIARALQRLGVEVVQGSCAGMAPGSLLLASGERLACDLPVLAVGAQAPAWLAGSGLGLDGAGFVAVNAFQQSTSHAEVFAVGDVASRVDAPHARSGVYAVRAGPPLLANLRAALQGQPLTTYRPQQRTLNLLSCGSRHAIAVWGGLSVEGAWVWRWKDRIDRRFVAGYA
ncbi:MAG: hypothetical protein JWP79_2649, partial [Polaromonas sp.]|nr:hypothetical protein [Polaromonas sp.]